MRILLVCPSWGRPCGIACYTRNLRGGLEALGVAGDVATGPGSVRRFLAEQKYDGVLLQHEYGLYYFNLLGVLGALGKSGLPLAITMHNTDLGGWMGAQHLFLFQAGAKLVVHSREARENLLQSAPPPDESSLRIIPMGCLVYRDWGVSPEEVRAELDLPQQRFTVGFFGFAAAHKGIANLVRALQSLPEVSGYIQASIHPVNPGAVDEVYRELNLPRGKPEGNTHGNVVFSHLPVPDDRLGYRQGAVDLIVLPYSRHGTSVSTSMQACDSLVARRPVMTSDAVYFSGLEREVWKIADCRPETIATGIRKLRDDADLCRDLVARAGVYAQRNAWPRVAGAYLDLLAEG